MMMNVSNSNSHSTWHSMWNAMFLGDENKYNASFFRIEFIPLTSRLLGFVGVVLLDRLENKEALVSWATLTAYVNILPDLHVKHIMRPRRTTTYASYSAMIPHDSTTIWPEMSTIRYKIVAGSPGQGNQKWMMIPDERKESCKIKQVPLIVTLTTTASLYWDKSWGNTTATT